MSMRFSKVFGVLKLLQLNSRCFLASLNGRKKLGPHRALWKILHFFFMHYSIPLCAYASSKGAVQNAHIHTLVKEHLTANNPLPKKSELWLNLRTIQFCHISLW